MLYISQSPTVKYRAFQNSKLKSILKFKNGQKHINQYRVDKKIGEGSTSVVKLVIDTERKRKFAMKIFYKTILKKRTKIVKSPSGEKKAFILSFDDCI